VRTEKGAVALERPSTYALLPGRPISLDPWYGPRLSKVAVQNRENTDTGMACLIMPGNSERRSRPIVEAGQNSAGCACCLDLQTGRYPEQPLHRRLVISREPDAGSGGEPGLWLPGLPGPAACQGTRTQPTAGCRQKETVSSERKFGIQAEVEPR